MLDIQFIRDNANLVKQKSKQKGYEVDIDKLLELDKKRRDLIQKKDEIRAELNKAADRFKSQPPDESQRNQLKQTKENLHIELSQLEDVEKEFYLILKAVPNMPLDDVPLGTSEKDNENGELKGTKPSFNFKPKTHWQLGEESGFIDKVHAAQVAGSRFAYLKGGLVKLQFAIIQYVLKTLTEDEVIKKVIQDNQLNIKPEVFVPIIPPFMIRTEIFEAMDRLEPSDDRYKVGEEKDKLWLQGSAEHTIGPIHQGDLLSEEGYPKRYLGYATSFRREAGSYGKDTEGIVRMHQFDKLEMEVFSTPETGKDEHLLLIALQEYMMNELGIPYRVVTKCTADIGKPNARGVDLEAWMPGENRFLETHTADYMTDYQARRLKTKVRRNNGDIEFVHMNDGTAFALGRTMAAIIENNQTKNGDVTIPEVLRPFMEGKDKI